MHAMLPVDITSVAIYWILDSTVYVSSDVMCGCRTRVLVQSERSEAEVNPPLFPDVFLHQTVEEEDEKS